MKENKKKELKKLKEILANFIKEITASTNESTTDEEIEAIQKAKDEVAKIEFMIKNNFNNE